MQLTNTTLVLRQQGLHGALWHQQAAQGMLAAVFTVIQKVTSNSVVRRQETRRSVVVHPVKISAGAKDNRASLKAPTELLPHLLAKTAITDQQDLILKSKFISAHLYI